MTVADNPYPGARPLSADEAQLLIGRESDLAKLVEAVEKPNVKIIELTADSGIGKSSLINAGLIPEFRRNGAVVVSIDSWSDLVGETDLERYVYVLRRALGDLSGAAGTPIDTSASSLEYLDKLGERYGGRLVVVFDQFEELFREDDELGSGLIHQIGELITSPVVEIPFTHVVSMRREFSDELRPLENMLDRSQVRTMRLREVDDSEILSVICEPLWQLDVPVEVLSRPVDEKCLGGQLVTS